MDNKFDQHDQWYQDSIRAVETGQNAYVNRFGHVILISDVAVDLTKERPQLAGLVKKALLERK